MNEEERRRHFIDVFTAQGVAILRMRGNWDEAELEKYVRVIARDADATYDAVRRVETKEQGA
jgi:hypothetical protein